MLIGYKYGPILKVVVMDPQFSNHCPLNVKIEVVGARKVKVFKLYNYLSTNPTFLQVVKKEWCKRVQGYGMRAIWNKFK